VVTILVKAEGIWVFQFDQAKKTALAKLIAGKSKKDAQALLAQQDGVAQVGKIDVSNTSDDLLPTDYKQITIVVQNVPGLKATPTSGIGTPTPSPTRGSPVPRPTGSPPGK
jgi:VCBS repeat-containing protein